MLHHGLRQVNINFEFIEHANSNEHVFRRLPLDYNLFHEVKAVIKALPPVNVVFGINQDDDSVYRAVRSVEPIGVS